MRNFFSGDEVTSHDEFDSRARKIASVIRARGVGENEVIAILMRNDTSYFEVIEACRYLGAYYTTLNWHSPPNDIESIVRDSGAKVLIGHNDLISNLPNLQSESLTVLTLPAAAIVKDTYGHNVNASAQGFDLGSLLTETAPIKSPPLPLRGLFAYTAGSTGRPKGIKRLFNKKGPDLFDTYRHLARQVLQLNEGDRYYIAAPLYHSAPNNISVCCLAAGNVDLFIVPKFDAEQFLIDIERHKITHAYIVPTMAVRLLKLPKEAREKYDVSSLRFAFSTGSPFPPEVKKEIIEWFGPIIYEAYGASEIGIMTMISSDEALLKPGSVGKPLPGTSIIILDEASEPVLNGKEGLIYIDLNILGDFNYSNDEGNIDNHRFNNHVTVGDIGYMDEEGYLYISDRKKDMIISGGINVFPAEIEAALIEMPDIVDCAVFGAPDSEFGEMIVVAVECCKNKSVTLSDIKQFLEPKIARYKMPKKLDIHQNLPREDSGKIFKHFLREPYWQDVKRTI